MREQIAQLHKQYSMQYQLSLKYATEISHWADKRAKERRERSHSAEGRNKLKEEEKEERMRSYNEFLKLVFCIIFQCKDSPPLFYFRENRLLIFHALHY